MSNMTRRTFLKRSALAAGVMGFAARSWAQVPGANEDIRVAVVGFNGRGRSHISSWLKTKGVRLTALCDVDSKVIEAELGRLEKDGPKVETYTDIRKLLASKNVDAISIATPNHWHALATVWGLQAGKHVYVEKPVSHNVWEGEKMVQAARRYEKIVQAGTQSRSSSGLKEAVAWVHQGNLGRILVARALCYKPRPSIGKADGPQAVPASVDYDLWCGPAPLTPPRRRQFHYDWHWFWDYGAGEVGNQAIHETDVARWFLGEQVLSPRVLALGSRFGYVDDGETPNTLVVFHDYVKAPLLIEVRGLPEKAGSREMDNYKGAKVGVVVECEGGHVLVSDYMSATAFDKAGKEIRRFTGASSHFENFIEAVRSRNESVLNAPILQGHLSSALCHTANISYRLGSWQSPDAIREQIKGDRDALPTFQRLSEHLAANNVDLEKTPATLGAVLKMNPANSKFIENKQANYLLTRTPREPYGIRVG
ncbi:MAG: Gfo/Idh/MocA family oxidoreductase [Verrucomicrobiota bacterium]|jgi:predicted dehydrogenase